MSNWFKIFFFVCCLMANPANAKTMYKFPTPSGAFSIGLTHKKFYDYDRAKQIPVTIYYPTAAHEECTKLDVEYINTLVDAFSLKHLDSFSYHVNRWLPASLVQSTEEMDAYRQGLERIYLPHQLDAAFVPNIKFPVIYMAPDQDFCASDYQNMIHEIVSHGYVIMVMPASADISTYEKNFEYVINASENDIKLIPFCNFSKKIVLGHGNGGNAILGATHIEHIKVLARIMLDQGGKSFILPNIPTFYAISPKMDALQASGLRHDIPNLLKASLCELTEGAYIDRLFIDKLIHNKEIEGDQTVQKFDEFLMDLLGFLEGIQ